MRVITGKARGRKLETLKGDSVRPTADRVKEAVFSIIQFEVAGKRFLDLFSGSGQMGIEALSRGAKEAYFIDKNREAIEIIKKNIKKAEVTDRAIVKENDSFKFLLETQTKFDIVYIDPPFMIEKMNQIIEMVTHVTNNDGFIICETPKDKELVSNIEGFSILRQYKYGKIMISIFRKCAE